MAINQPISRYWDSCNFLSLIAEDEVARADICQHILEDAEAHKTSIITSAFTIAEVIHPKGKSILTVAQESIIANFFLHEYVLIHDVTRAVAEDARKLSREHGLKPSDAIHLATALRADAAVFESWNINCFGRLSGKVPIDIRIPTWEGNLEMPLKADSEDWGKLPKMGEE